MEAFIHLRNEIALNTFDIGTTCWVDVTHINTPYSFYVRPRSYRMFMQYLQARGRRMLPCEIAVGDIVIFSSKILKSNVRGKVLFVEEGDNPLYTLQAIDFGCFELSVPIASIWRRHHKSELPPLVTHCQLADCTPRSLIWDDKGIDTMKKSVEGESAMIFIRNKSSGVIIVELYNSGHNDVSILLALAGYTDISYNVEHNFRLNPVQEVKHLHYPLRKLEVKSVMHVRMQNGSLSNKFYVALMDEYRYYIRTYDNFSADVRAQDPRHLADIIVGKPVAVFHDLLDRFERGLVKSVFDQGIMATVELVDWGVKVEEPVYNLKPLPENYLCLPARAICCSIDKSQSNLTGLAHLSNTGAQFMITIKEVSEDVQEIWLPCVENTG